MAELILPDPPLEKLTDRFVGECLKRKDVQLANTEPANNHLDGGFSEVSPELAEGVVHELAEFSEPLLENIQFVAPVPTGANGWATALKAQRQASGLVVLTTEKVERRKFRVTDTTKAQLEKLFALSDTPEGAVIDDVTYDGGTSEAMADFLRTQGLEIKVVMSLFYRGRLELLDSKYQRASLMARFIPRFID